MQYPVQALVWELWRTSHREVLTRLVTAMFFAAIISGLGRVTALGPESWVFSGIFLMVAFMVASSTELCLGRLSTAHTGFDLSWQFVRPVSLWLLVGVPVIYGILTSVCNFLAAAFVYQMLSSAKIPLIEPVVAVCTFVVCLFAATWSMASLVGRWCAMMLCCTGWLSLLLLAGSGKQEPWLMTLGRPEAFQWHWPQFLTMGLLAGIAFLVTMHGVGRQRCGESIFKFGPRKERARQTTQHSNTKSLARLPLFASRFWAQLWYEFRASGQRTLVLSLLLPPAVGLVTAVCLICGFEGQTITRVWGLTLLLSPVVYQVVGIDGALGLKKVGGVMRLPTFDALLPETSTRVIEIKLMLTAATSFGGWLLMLLMVSALSLILDLEWGVAGEFGRQLAETPMRSILLLASGVAMAITSSSAGLLAIWLWLPRHPRFGLALVGFLTAHVFIFIWDSTQQWRFAALWQIYGFIFPIAGLITCSWILWFGFRAGLFRTQLFRWGVICWMLQHLAVVAFFELINRDLFELPAQFCFAIPSLLVTPLAALVAAPLALDEHRHQ